MASMDETQTKPNRRRIDSDSGNVQHGHAGPEAFSGAERLDTLQTHVGNELVLDALSGQGDDAFLRLIGGEVSESIAAPGEGPFQSNAAMLRYMRDASIDWEDPALEKLAHPTGGRALNPEQLERFNAAFAHDFSHVRIHTDAAAARAAEALHAHAFALGSHIFFGTGTYGEGRAADRLLAHELTHVVQHDEGRLPKSGDEGVSHPSDPTEQEAYANEVRIVNKLDAIDAAMSSPDIEPESDLGAQPEFTAAAGDVSSTDVSDMEQPTLDNWPGFGGDAPEAPTEGEGVAIGGLAMRRRDALTEADTSDARVLKLIRQSRGTPIPEAVVEGVGRVLGGAFASDQGNHHGAAAQLQQLVNALGADVFGGGDATEVIAQKITHALNSSNAASVSKSTHEEETKAVGTRLAQGLGLGKVVVHTGEEGQRRARLAGSRGVMEGGEVFLDSETYDPSTKDGVRLIAHEMAHVAQEGLPVADVPNPGLVAEHDATNFAEQYAAGNSTAKVNVGLPSAHVAAENGAAQAETKSEEEDGLVAEMIAKLFDALTGGGDGETQNDETQNVEPEQETFAEDAPADSGASSEPSPSEPLEPIKPQNGGPQQPAEPSQTPATQEASASQSANIGDEPDGFADYYMETHWDSAAFHQLGQSVGYPDGPSSVSEIDKLLPADTSPEVRGAINVACAIGSGILDDWVIQQASEYIGIPGDWVTGMIGLANDYDDRVQLEDPVGMALWMGCETLGAILGAIETVVDDVLEDVANLQLALDSLLLLEATLGQVVALGANIVPVAGMAAVEGLLVTIAGWVVAIHSALDMVRLPVQGLKATIEVLQASMTTLQYVYNDYQANELEANGNMEKAAAYRDLARGMVIDQFLEWLSALKNVAFCIPMIGSRGKELERGGKLLLHAGRRVGTRLLFGGGSGSGMGATDIAKLIVDELANGTDWWHEVGLPGMQADTMRSGFMEGEALGESGGGSAAVLNAARMQSIQWLDDSAVSLAADGPEWYQKLVNEIANPPERSQSETTSATYWLAEFLGQIPYVWEIVKDGSLESLASGCDVVAGVLPLAQPFADEFTGMFNSIKPQLDEVVVKLNDFVQEQSVNLDQMQGMLTSLQQGIASVEEMTATEGSIDTSLQEIIDTLADLRLEPGELALPAIVPADAVNAALDPINSIIDGAVETLTEGKDAMVKSVAETVSEIADAFSVKVEILEASIAEGGSFRVELEAQVVAFQETVAAVTEAFVEMDGTIDIDTGAAAAWLSSVADACRAAAAEEGQDSEQVWPEILKSTAQPAVNAWRSRHEEEVYTQYMPEIPTWELDAIEQVKTDIECLTGVDGFALGNMLRAYGEVMKYRGRKGRQELLGFWSAESEFLASAQAAESSAS